MATISAGVGPCWTETIRRRKDGTPCRRNLWHTTLMQTYSDAAWSWWQEAEAVTSLHATELDDFRPRPRLRDFMVHLSRDWRDGRAA